MREKIIAYIREGKTEEALKLALDFFSAMDTGINQSLTLLLNQFNNLKQRKLLGLGENFEGESRIVKALIELIKQSDKEEYNTESILSEIDSKRQQEQEQQVKLLLDELHNFCKSVEGYWLSYGSDVDLIGFVLFKTDKARITVQKKGEAYNSKGEKIYQWQSVASALDLVNEKLNYIWEGNIYEKLPGSNIRRTKEPKHKGWGELSFRNKKNDKFEFATGKFYDTELGNWNVSKSSTYKRGSPEDMEIVYSGERSSIAELVQRLLKGSTQ